VILVDTSVWIGHWRHGDAAFAALLDAGHVAVHPFIVGELALGALHPRAEVLATLRELPAATVAEHEEVLALVERERLWGRGVGWLDCHLLASARLDRLRLWSRDRALVAAARHLGVVYSSA
jgi:predicted nucleic acid-binding protein